jgi:hypothetical protein
MGGGGFKQMLPGLLMAGLGGFAGPMMGMASTSTLFGGAFNGTAALIAGGLGSAMLSTPPDVPDFQNDFQFQSDLLDRQNSFGRRNDFELRDLLENGSENDKNLAFDELRRRGEDEDVLREIEGRSTRSDQDQSLLDQFNVDNQAPTSEESEALRALYEAAGQAGLDEELDDIFTQIKQKSAGRGTLDSSRNDQLNIAAAAEANKQSLLYKTAAAQTVGVIQSGDEKLRQANFNRMLSTGNFAKQQGDASLQFATAERKYQEALRAAPTAQARALAFQRFQADIDRQLAVYNQGSTTARDRGNLGLGIVGSAIRNPFDAIPSVKDDDPLPQVSNFPRNNFPMDEDRY